RRWKEAIETPRCDRFGGVVSDAEAELDVEASDGLHAARSDDLLEIERDALLLVFRAGTGECGEDGEEQCGTSHAGHNVASRLLPSSVVDSPDSIDRVTPTLEP